MPFCVDCGAQLPDELPNEVGDVIACEYCGSTLPTSIWKGGNRNPPSTQGSVPIPQGYQVSDDGHRLSIVIPWFSPVFFFLVFFCLFWDGFLIAWYFFIPTGEMGWMGLAFLLFPLIHVAVGVGLTYFTIAGFVNRTEIMVQDDVLSVKHVPLPWPGNLQIATSEIQQLFCDAHQTVNEGRVSIFYKVYVVDRNNERKKLLGPLSDKQHALFLEQAIENHLRIEDQHIPGQITG